MQLLFGYLVFTFLKADMNSDILLQTAAIFFSDESLCERRCMSCLISFAWASSSFRSGSEIKKKNEKFFLPTAGLELTTFGL